MDKELADIIKDTIDENMFKEIESLASEQGLTTSGWLRKNIWDLIREQRK
ncbi:hypothetical protein [Paenibacillus bouchesdurhonensis]|nr:hypothetical protein [Paenibacillus bouchesdurhonensis]